MTEGHGTDVLIDVTSLISAEDYLVSQNRHIRPGDPFARQCFVDAPVPDQVAVDLAERVIGSVEPLVDPDDRRHPGRGAQHAHVLRSPVAHANNANPDSVRLRAHSVLPLCSYF